MTRMPAIALTLLALAAPLRAQNQVASSAPTRAGSARSRIEGLVVDSINGTSLSGADVVVQGARAELKTDSAGKFTIDSLAPGTYQVGVFHPLLDTLGITLATKPFRVGPDSSTFVMLAVPTVETLVNRTCDYRTTQNRPSAIIGHLVDPETLEPIANAEVSVAWSDIDVSKTLGIKQTARLLRDTTDAFGAFQLCGLPNPMQGTLQAKHGTAMSTEIPVSLGDKPVELLARTLTFSPSTAAAKTGNAKLSGVVSLEGNETGAGSRLEIVGTDVVAMTNEKGEFSMANLPSGTKVLLARHLGFGAKALPVDLSSREERHVALKLPKFVAVMDPVLVKARRLATLDKVGYNERKRTGYGFFMGPVELEKLKLRTVTDILRRVPGLDMSYDVQGEVVSSTREGNSTCVQYFLDDIPFVEAMPGDINNFVNGLEIVALEAYQENNVPVQYIRNGRSCTTIVLWTKFKIRG
ncbi:MAG TPA: carboxypeptidase regulatory-like domain-containing protein [Gemmatimonadaceae bacterium]